MEIIFRIHFSHFCAHQCGYYIATAYGAFLIGIGLIRQRAWLEVAGSSVLDDSEE